MFITFVFLNTQIVKHFKNITLINTKHDIKYDIYKTRFMTFINITFYNINLRTSNVYKHTSVKVIQHNMSSINVINYNMFINL